MTDKNIRIYSQEWINRRNATVSCAVQMLSYANSEIYLYQKEINTTRRRLFNLGIQVAATACDCHERAQNSTRLYRDIIQNLIYADTPPDNSVHKSYYTADWYEKNYEDISHSLLIIAEEKIGFYTDAPDYSTCRRRLFEMGIEMAMLSIDEEKNPHDVLRMYKDVADELVSIIEEEYGARGESDYITGTEALARFHKWLTSPPDGRAERFEERWRYGTAGTGV